MIKNKITLTLLLSLSLSSSVCAMKRTMTSAGSDDEPVSPLTRLANLNEEVADIATNNDLRKRERRAEIQPLIEEAEGLYDDLDETSKNIVESSTDTYAHLAAILTQMRHEEVDIEDSIKQNLDLPSSSDEDEEEGKKEEKEEGK